MAAEEPPGAERRKLIETYRARLAVLERQRAGFGDLHVPPHVITEIEEIRRALSALGAAPDTPDPAHAGAAPLRMLALIAAPLIYHTPQGDLPVAALAVQEELEAIAAACKMLDPRAALDIRVEIASADAIGRVFATNRAPFDIL
ncbi:MAG TPA: hypothetical protein VF897_11415, partial [Roseiflexaceae bacterium]